MMELADYMRELVLMRRQYGQEEELYPLINILLREYGKLEELSLRDVSNHRSAGMKRKILYGYASFPDIVILDEKCDLRFEELEKKYDGYFQFRNPQLKTKIDEIDNYKNNNGDKKDIIKGIDDKEEIDKIKNIVSTWNKIQDLKYDDIPEKDEIKEAVKIQLNYMYGCVEAKGQNANKNEIIPLKIPNTKNAVFSFRKCNKEFTFNANGEKIYLPFCQFVGELLMYGKVLYTDGIVWKYYEIKTENRNDIRDKLLEVCILKRYDWTEKLEDFNFGYMCVDIGNLENVFNPLYKSLKDKIDIKNINDYLLVNDDNEWKRLSENLARIDWTGSNDYSQFNVKGKRK